MWNTLDTAIARSCASKVLREYLNEEFDFEVVARIIHGTDVVASDVLFRITLNGHLAYARVIDGARCIQPSVGEHERIQTEFRNSLNHALAPSIP